MSSIKFVMVKAELLKHNTKATPRPLFDFANRTL